MTSTLVVLWPEKILEMILLFFKICQSLIYRPQYFKKCFWWLQHVVMMENQPSGLCPKVVNECLSVHLPAASELELMLWARALLPRQKLTFLIGKAIELSSIKHVHTHQSLTRQLKDCHKLLWDPLCPPSPQPLQAWSCPPSQMLEGWWQHSPHKGICIWNLGPLPGDLRRTVPRVPTSQS